MDSLLFAARSCFTRPYICRACLGARQKTTKVLSSSHRILNDFSRTQKRHKVYIASGEDQAKPLEGFYADLLSNPISSTQSATRTQPATPPAESLPKTQKEETLAKARIVFGSRLAGPSERKDDIESRSTRIAGVLVPPRPSEPDNCCMSGCVNCVWDIYRDELEEWAAKSAEARVRSRALGAEGKEKQRMYREPRVIAEVAMSMDDDGGGSETNWALDSGGQDLFEGIPVGIRQFMMTEKMIKQRHSKDEPAKS